MSVLLFFAGLYLMFDGHPFIGFIVLLAAFNYD